MQKKLHTLTETRCFSRLMKINLLFINFVQISIQTHTTIIISPRQDNFWELFSNKYSPINISQKRRGLFNCVESILWHHYLLKCTFYAWFNIEFCSIICSVHFSIASCMGGTWLNRVNRSVTACYRITMFTDDGSHLAALCLHFK